MKGFRTKIVYMVSIFLVLTFVYLINFHFHFHKFQLENDKMQGAAAFRFRKRAVELSPSCETVLAIILCAMNDTSESESGPARDFARQMNQTIVLLKSIVLTAKYSTRPHDYCIKVIVVSDQREHFEKLKEEIFEREAWDIEFTKYLRLSHVTANYPEEFYWMKTLFRPCATMRLFLPELIPHQDAVIYLDTDIIFFRDVRDLWSELKQMSNETLGAMAPCLFHYGSKKNNVPFYGASGLNAGIMYMNLTRMKNTLWTRKIHLVTEMFQRQIKLADQDILNIYFHYFPEEVDVISCDWNFRPFQCRQGSYCEDSALAQGISALHGNALSFTENGPEPLFRTVFHAFQRAQLSLESNFDIRTFVENLSFSLMQAEEKYHTDCSKYGSFSPLVMSRLTQMVSRV